MYRSLLEIPFEAAQRFPDRVSHRWRTLNGTVTRSYADFAAFVRVLTAGFAKAGIAKGEHVGFFVNNRYEWIATDFALMALGAVSVPRGSDTSPKEVGFIFKHSDSRHLILENTEQLSALSGEIPADDWATCATVFILDGSRNDELPAFLRDKIVFYEDLVTMGQEGVSADPGLVERLEAAIQPSDLLTIVYTSGTTGNPKGVMLTHANFLQNVVANTPRLEMDPDAAETTVVMLPSWHVYERAFEYCAMTAGVTLVYSSAGRFSADLASEKPQVLISVPRVWESVYQKLLKAFSEMHSGKRNLVLLFIKLNQAWMTSSQYLKGGYISLKRRSALRKAGAWLYALVRTIILYPAHRLAWVLFKPFREKVGGRLKVASCGAGSLPKYLDELFNAIGITLVNAYGMTECAPGILSRTLSRNTFGSTGVPFDNTEVVIRREDGTETDIGEKGLLFVRGPQVMQGYYKNPQATMAVLDSDGWLNTGDLAVRSENGEIIIVGRLKDTIVLMGGENVEPEPIEDKIKESAYIDHAVVIGQDQKQLSAIVAINEDELMRLAAELKLSRDEVLTEGSLSIENDIIYRELLKEVNMRISKEQGFKPFERITHIFPVLNDFSVGKELTQTLKVKRRYVEERFNELVAKLFGNQHKK
ncbi:MAG: AMP-binding protein [Spirochaetales bacterium]|nr:AMP-binding protein [Spirochaetales bacterium]